MTANNDSFLRALSIQAGYDVKILEEDDFVTVRRNEITSSCANATIYPTPYELFLMCDKMGISSNDFIIKYCDVDANTNKSKVPMLYMKNTKCKFGKGNKCTLGDSKPIVCSLYPLARAKTLDNESRKFTSIYFTEDKESIGEAIRVSDWLIENKLEEKDKWSEKYHFVVYEILKMLDFNKLHETTEISYENKMMVYSNFISTIYSNYEPNTNMRIDYRLQLLIELIEELLEIYPILKKE